MSTGKEIPYQLRPNKFIDRQIFLELAGRIVPQKKAGRYVYISMGGKHLVDHEAFYRRLGISKLYSFDSDPTVVDRQLCNRPVSTAKCVELMSGSLAGEIDSILTDFSPASNMIVWLDYTRPSERLSQLQELTECLKKAQPGDLFRITMNADDFTLRGDWRKDDFETPGLYRADRLKSQIGDFYPSKILTIGDDELPEVLVRSIILACSAASQGKRITFHPVLNTAYADGQRMVTSAVLALSSGDALPTGLLDWEFLPNSDSDCVNISVPDLSMREKILIDRFLDRSPAQIVKAAKFLPTSEADDAREALKSYKRLHRFFPTFMAIGVQ